MFGRDNFIRLDRHDLEPRGDCPPEWEREDEAPTEEYEPEPPDPDNAYLPEDCGW